MPITPEQADQAKDIILQTLDTHHQGRLPYREVWTKAAANSDGVPFLKVWVIYDGKARRPGHRYAQLLRPLPYESPA